MILTETNTKPRPRSGRFGAIFGSLGVGGTLSLAVVVLLILMTVLAPIITPQDPNRADILSSLEGPSAEHLLGTDSSGRDLLSRLIVGSQTAIAGAVLTVAFSAILGVTVGLISGWFGGAIDRVITRIQDLLFAFPGLLLALIVVALFPRNLITSAAALALSSSPFLARIIRGEVLRFRHQPFMEALELQGFSVIQLWFRHVLPNIMIVLVAQLTLLFGYSLVGLATLSYLGLGVQPPTADWGRMVSDGQAHLQNGYPQECLLASLMIAIAVLSFSFLGDRLSQRAHEVKR